MNMDSTPSGNFIRDGESVSQADHRAAMEKAKRLQDEANQDAQPRGKTTSQSSYDYGSSEPGDYKIAPLGMVIQAIGVGLIVCAWFIPSVIHSLFGEEEFSKVSISITGVAIIFLPLLHRWIKIGGVAFGLITLIAGGFPQGENQDVSWSIMNIPSEAWLMGIGFIVGSVVLASLIAQKRN